jgi:hypothetical protein
VGALVVADAGAAQASVTASAAMADPIRWRWLSTRTIKKQLKARR